MNGWMDDLDLDLWKNPWTNLIHFLWIKRDMI
jgi:hypothetical protein